MEPGAFGLHALPALRDNYIWIFFDSANAIVVDPGESAGVERWLTDQGRTLRAILLTHHHGDHTGGVAELTAQRSIPVFGPAAEGIAGVTQGLHDGDRLPLASLGFSAGKMLELEVLEVPGHTAGHLAYYCAGAALLWCGDTLFSAGCGRIFDGTAAQLHASLERLAALPDSTRVCCTHEYTLANLAFAQAAEPDNPARDAWLAEVRELRAAGQPSLPSTIARERVINPFLRTEAATVLAAARAQAGRPVAEGLDCFTVLRAWKDGFQAPL